MKKSLMCLVVVILSLTSIFGQNKSVVESVSNTEISSEILYLHSEVDHIRYCMGKYNEQVSMGYIMTGLGLALSITTVTADLKPKNSDVGLKIVNGMAILCDVIGIAMIIDANKWTKRIYVGETGIGLKYKF